MPLTRDYICPGQRLVSTHHADTPASPLADSLRPIRIIPAYPRITLVQRLDAASSGPVRSNVVREPRPGQTTSKAMLKVTITKLQYLIRENLVPQYVLAGICRTHPTTFSETVRGLRPMTADMAMRLAQFFEVDPSELLGTVDVTVTVDK